MSNNPGAPESLTVPGGSTRSTSGTDLDRRRVGRPERDRTITLLSQAVSADYLTLSEFEERSARAALARTQSELDALTRDLPPDLLRRLGRDERRARTTRAALLGVRIHVGAYLATSVFMVALWLVIAVATGAWYPWPIWPILGWGIGVLGHAVPVALVARNQAGAQPPR